jgi:uncharacterized metal-binding protein YceD (DUF177 family)
LFDIFLLPLRSFVEKEGLGKFDLYKIDLKSMRTDVQQEEYLLDNQYFTNIGGEDIQKGKVKAFVTITHAAGVFNFSFNFIGMVVIPCDRCLDDMEYPIETTARLIVKFGKDYSEESDEIVVIPESEGSINLAWFLYEFVALAIPIKHVHLPGKCNKQMNAKLKKHTAKTDDDGDDSFDDDTDNIVITDDDKSDDSTDPRWDTLKKIKDEDDY